jgi:biopolymer transport protein ExbB
VKALPYVFCITLLTLAPCWGEAITKSNTWAEKAFVELKKHRTVLDQQTEQILKEKKNLAQQILECEEQCKLLQTQRQELQDFTKNESIIDSDLREQKRLLDTLKTNLMEGRQIMEKNMTPVQQMFYRQKLQDFDANLAHSKHADLPRYTQELLQLNLEMNHKTEQLQTYTGNVLEPHGAKVFKQLLDLGPVAFSYSADHSQLTLLDPRHLGSIPHETLITQPIPPQDVIIMPVDLAQGKSLQQLEAKTNLWQRLLAGGVLVWPILALGLIGGLGMTWRFIVLMQYGLKTTARHPIISRLRLCAQSHRQLPREALIERLYDEIDNCTPAVERFLATLNILASISPLMGLLGTVTGMIKTFQSMSLNSGQTTMISGGIAEALTTTACGLIVAIPLMLGHALLSRKAKAIIQMAEAEIHPLADEVLGAHVSPVNALASP